MGSAFGRGRNSWLLALEAEGKSSRTIKSYGAAVNKLEEFLVCRRFPTTVTALEQGQLAAFLAGLQKGMARSSVATRYDGLKAFFSWLEEDKEIGLTPMHGIRGQPSRLTTCRSSVERRRQ